MCSVCIEQETKPGHHVTRKQGEREVWLLNMEPYSLFHSNGQFLIEQLVALVGRQVNAVEAGERTKYLLEATTQWCTHTKCGPLVSWRSAGPPGGL